MNDEADVVLQFCAVLREVEPEIETLTFQDPADFSLTTHVTLGSTRMKISACCYSGASDPELLRMYAERVVANLRTPGHIGPRLTLEFK